MDRELVQIFGAAAALVAIILGLALMGSAWSCSSKWERSGFRSDWGPVQGCMIEVQRGKWIPEERYRELDE